MLLSFPLEINYKPLSRDGAADIAGRWKHISEKSGDNWTNKFNALV
jgi:hypothetical protein